MESPWERWESFWVGGVRRGAAFRSFDGGLLVTRIAFDDGAGAPFAMQSSLSVSGGTWDSLSFRQEPGRVRNVIDRYEAGHDVNTLPASGEYLLVSRVARARQKSASYARIDEGQPLALPAPAEIRRGADATVDFPDGRSLLAERFDIVAGGMRVATHWVADGTVMRSAWGGALSFSCATEAHALNDIDPRIGEFLRHGFRG